MCEITVTSVRAFNDSPDQRVVEVRIAGTVVGCENLRVVLNDASTDLTVSGGAGAWEAVFHTRLRPLRCKELVTIMVECADGGHDCEPVSKTIALECEPLDPPPTNCSEYSVTVETTPGNCVNGTRQITAEATPIGPTAPEAYQWTWSNGQSSEGGASDTEAFDPAIEIGSVSVKATWPNLCEKTATQAFVLEPCQPQCPEITDIEVHVGDCENGVRAVSFEAVVNGQAEGNFMWTYGDGDSAATSGPTAVHAYGHDGEYTVAVSAEGPGRCPGASFEKNIRLDPCPDEESVEDDDDVVRPPRNGGVVSPCAILRLLGITFLILGLALILGGACSGAAPVAIAGGILAGIGAVLLVVWAIVCTRAAGGCFEFQRLLEVLALLDIVFGIFAVIFWLTGMAPCLLGALIDLGIISTLGAILLLIFFQIGCRTRRPTLVDILTGRGN
jgi:hypothetical protein